MWKRNTHSAVAFDNRSVDKVEGLHCREGDAENTEERDKAGIHLVPPTSCLGSNKAKVLENFAVKLLPSVIYASPVQQQLQKCNRLLCAVIIHLGEHTVYYNIVKNTSVVTHHSKGDKKLG